MIDHEYDYDNQFFRSVTVALAKTWSKQIRWINRFEDKNVRVFLPFYTSLTADERFVFDAFVDDIVDKRVLTNTDQYQRGMISFNGTTPRSDELNNPNQYISKKVKIDKKIRKVISKVKAVPITVNYDFEIQLATQNEVDKTLQKIYDTFYNYMFFNFDYYGLKIDAFFLLPDGKSIETPKEITMDSSRNKMIKFSLEVKTYYPIFMISTDDLIPCANDGEIDWDALGIPQPTDDFLESLKAWNESQNNTNIAGGTKGDVKEGMTEIRKVYWNKFYYELAQYQYNDTVNNVINPKDRPMENFNGVSPDESSKPKRPE